MCERFQSCWLRWRIRCPTTLASTNLLARPNGPQQAKVTDGARHFYKWTAESVSLLLMNVFHAPRYCQHGDNSDALFFEPATKKRGGAAGCYTREQEDPALSAPCNWCGHISHCVSAPTATVSLGCLIKTNTHTHTCLLYSLYILFFPIISHTRTFRWYPLSPTVYLVVLPSSLTGTSCSLFYPFLRAIKKTQN